jgi:hypothetical protein
MSNQPDLNYTKEAFLMPWNLTFLIAAMVMILAMNFLVPMSPASSEFVTNLMLLGTFGSELMYLGMMPKDKRFQRAIRSRYNAEMSKQANTEKERFQQLNRQSQQQYLQLRNVEKSIEANYKKLSSASQGLLESHIKKIDGLLDSYLNMLFQKERYNYLRQNDRETQIAQAIHELRVDMEDDAPKVRAIKERRLKILEKRLDELKRFKENQEILDAQMATIEDVIRYIHEQSLTMKDPEGITFQLDTLLSEVEETQSSVSELEDVFSQTGNLLSDMDSYDMGSSITGNEGTRINS